MLQGNVLGAYLRQRRTKLDPAAFGFDAGRRRTSGLRREEIAQLAHISATWYTWLEQGRGGKPSAVLLDRLAQALRLTEAEREHLFLLGLGRLPEVRYRACDAITPRLQRVLDVLTDSPAIVRTATWDVIAWNQAAAVVFTDYGQLTPAERNILRLKFCEPRMRTVQGDWQSVARLVVASFRRDAARAGADAEVEHLVAELSQSSPEFAAMWRDEDVQTDSNGVKHLRHPQLGALTLEFSSFAVDAQPDLSLIVYNPVAETDRRRIAAFIAEASHSAQPA